MLASLDLGFAMLCALDVFVLGGCWYCILFALDLRARPQKI